MAMFPSGGGSGSLRIMIAVATGRGLFSAIILWSSDSLKRLAREGSAVSLVSRSFDEHASVKIFSYYDMCSAIVSGAMINTV